MLFGPKQAFIIDYDTLADPRIAAFLSLGLVTGRFLVPDVPATKADNDHLHRRAREAIDKLRQVKGITLKLDRTLRDRDKLLAAAQKNKAVLITTDPELKAALRGSAVSASDIYNLFKPQYLPGTELKVRIAKKGKEKNEGIGYLEGGIKVVVEDAAAAVGSDLEVVIQGALDTDVGRVVFAKPRFTELT
jgi:uncharacterized protein YacL